MSLYFAPMEGITGSVYRSAHYHVFGGVDRYYSPFIFTSEGGKIGKRNRTEIYPEYNKGFELVPQLLSNCATDFIATAKTLKGLGYTEVNLNLGCPSNTVASKGRGSGFLGLPEQLERFLDEVFTHLDMKISLKTRLGLHSTDEFYHLLEIYNQFPITELTIHPRLRTDFYNGTPHLDLFDAAVAMAKMPLCYNGDIFTVEDYTHITQKYPTVSSYMMGRGLLANPALAREIKGGNPVQREELAMYFHEIQASYNERLEGSHKVMFLMKEFWTFVGRILSDSDQTEVNRLIHINERSAFEQASEELLSYCTIIPGRGFKH